MGYNCQSAPDWGDALHKYHPNVLSTNISYINRQAFRYQLGPSPPQLMPRPRPLHNFGRRLREELRHAEESSHTAKKIIGPVLLKARSCLGYVQGVSLPTAVQPRRWRADNRGQFESDAMLPSELGDEGGAEEMREVRRTRSMSYGEKRDVSGSLFSAPVAP